MRRSLRAKLLATLSTLMLGFAVLIVAGSWLERRVERELSLIRERYIPQLALAPTLEHELEALQRGMQDAVAAQDNEALDATTKRKERLLAALRESRALIDPRVVLELQTRIEDYHRVAYDVSQRILEGETGEALVDAMSEMQTKHLETQAILKRATTVDPRSLSKAFAEASDAQATASQLRLAIGLSCLVLVLMVGSAVGRSSLRAVAELSSGFDRFGRGEFDAHIPDLGSDELNRVASQANQMARSLQKLGLERDRSDWLKAGRAGLLEDLRGELSPKEVSTRACRFFARYLEAPSTALYYRGTDGLLRLLGHHAASVGDDESGLKESVAPGEGLVGQAALEQEIVVIDHLPASYVRVQSGLGQCVPTVLALVPLVHLGRVIGVLELASLKPWNDLFSELLLSTRESLATALEMAHNRASLRELLARTQGQARQLQAQEEELRTANLGLQRQQEELRTVNSQLLARSEDLERQRETLERSNRELAAARRTLEQKAHELETVSAYKSQFLANMSHELRTPLNSMLVLSNLLSANESGNLSDKQVEYCRTIHGAGKNLLTLIDQVLDLAKIEAGKQELRLSEVPMHELVDYVRRIFEPLARDKRLTLRTDLDPALPASIVTDQRKLEQVLNNLVGNAIKFTHHGEVRVRLRSPEATSAAPNSAAQTLILEVEDTGIGIPRSEQERIFSPFEQLEGTSDRRYGGTGLGLSIARELVTLLGGELTLHSVPGEGSRFVVYLPLAPAVQRPVTVSTVATAPANSNAAVSMKLNGKKILIADGDMRSVYALSSLLRAKGADVVTADHGSAAPEVLRQHSEVALVLMDFSADGEAALEALRQVRGDPRFARLPVVVLTSRSDSLDRASCIEMGATEQLYKPIEEQHVTTLLKRLLEPPQDTQQAS